MSDKGLFNEDMIIDCENNARDGYDVMLRFLKSGKPKPEVIFVSSDAAAPGIVKALHEYGISVPEEMGLITFNKTSLSEFSNPPLTSVELFMSEYAKMAAQSMFFGWNSGGELLAKKMVIPCKLIDRGSVC